MEKELKKRKRALGDQIGPGRDGQPSPITPRPQTGTPPLSPRHWHPGPARQISLTPLTLWPHLSVVPYLEQETDPNTASRLSVWFTLNPNSLAKPDGYKTPSTPPPISLHQSHQNTTRLHEFPLRSPPCLQPSPLDSDHFGEPEHPPPLPIFFFHSGESADTIISPNLTVFQARHLHLKVTDAERSPSRASSPRLETIDDLVHAPEVASLRWTP
jgi:hypothetical protein